MGGENLHKRVTSAILAIIISFTALCGKLYYIVSKAEFASVQSHIRVRELATKKGTIYDRNGDKMGIPYDGTLTKEDGKGKCHYQGT